jgi:hypothetical protein
MSRLRWVSLLLLLIPLNAGAGGELYGTVTLASGETLTGPIRWDHNENYWDDVLDATKSESLEEADEGFQLSIFGWKIASFGRTEAPRSVLSIAFGHLRSIEPSWNGGGTLELKNGRIVEAREGGDLGGSMRNLTVTPAGEESVEIEWDDVDRIDFAAGPGEGRDAERLYGVVETGSGKLTGFIVWDRDESLLEDVLDGYDEDRRSRDIPFADIRRIERVGHSRSRVTLRDGSEVVLRGTNDVDSDNRGIDVTIAGIGKAEVDWDEFENVTFKDPPASPRYEEFDGGRVLTGTVETVDGERLVGEIIWDLDERFTWESLNGERDDIGWEVPFANVRTIRPIDDDSSEIALRNGDKLVLRGSNDVDEDNRGVIVVDADGSERELEWDELRLVTFDGP